MPSADYCIREPSAESPLFSKILFIYNAVEDGWQVSLKDGDYVFLKPHEGRQEVYSASFLAEFIARQLRSPIS